MKENFGGKNLGRKVRRGAGAGRGASLRAEKREARARRGDGVLLSRLLFAALGTCVLALGAVSVQKVYERVGSQKIEYLKVEGSLGHVGELEVTRAVSRFRNDSMVAIDLDEVKRALEDHPWIRNVNIKREWPNTMIIDITEQVAIARWGEGGLLNQNGEIFRPRGVDKQNHLPYLTGPQGSEQEVMGQYQKFNQLLYPLGLRLASLDLNSRGAWRFVLDNGVTVKVGSSQVMDKMRRFALFVDSHFMEQLAEIESIDLRYSNGISVARRSLLEEKDEVVSL